MSSFVSFTVNVEAPSNTAALAQSDSKFGFLMTARIATDRKANLVGRVWIVASMAVLPSKTAFVTAA